MDAEQKSFEFAQDVTKQIISLSTAVPALMITFSKDFVHSVPTPVKTIAYWSWGCFLVAVFFGLLALMALTGILAKRSAAASLSVTGSSSSDPGTMSPNIRILAGVQIVAFFVGLALLVVFGWKAA